LDLLGLEQIPMMDLSSVKIVNLMFNKQKDVVKATSQENKTFNFSKNISKDVDVKLGFTLRVDVKQELDAFLELLKEAQKAVDEEIKNRFN